MKKLIYIILFFSISFFGYTQTACHGVCKYLDMDNDGFGAGPLTNPLAGNSYVNNNLDCNDEDPTINPNTIWYVDIDSDGYGNLSSGPIKTQCLQPQGYSIYNTDCNDANILINPDTIWYVDNDNDGFGNNNIGLSIVQCTKPLGNYVLNSNDCDDTNNAYTIVKTWAIDVDGDGFGETNPIVSCSKPTGGNYVNNNSDECPGVFGSIQGCIVSSPLTNSSFSSGQNFIMTTTPKIPVTNIQQINNEKDANINITYFDGLGRPIQQINHNMSGLGKDDVTHIEYDSYGRQVYDFLPLATSQKSLNYIDGNKVKASLISQYQNLYGDTNPFSQKLLEASPLNRVLKLAMPGNDWVMNAGHEIKFDYQTNVATGAQAVKFYKVTASSTNLTNDGYYSIALTDNGFYPSNQLFLTITKNENWVSGDNNTTHEYEDKEGRIVLKRTFGESFTSGVLTNVAHETYYVYDQYDNLTYVIPPKVDTSIALTTTILDNLCYQYRYDDRNRLVEKKLPGKQWEFIVYDKLDRVVATGPTLSPFTDAVANTYGWSLTKYDVFNRPIFTAWMPSTSVTSAGRKILQDAYSTTTAVLNEAKSTSATTINGIAYLYTNVAYPAVTTFHILTVNYYDNYDTNITFNPAITYSSSVTPQPVYYNNTSGTLPKGMPTVSWIRILEGIGTYNSEKNYTLYDKKSRPVRVFSNNYLGGFSQTDSQLESITGRLNYTITTHKKDVSATLLTVREDYTYTNQDRLLTKTHTINGGTPQLINKNDYDELGNLIIKRIGGQDITGATSFQKVDYNYNIRGWLKSINDVNDLKVATEKDMFAFKINYNTVENETNYTGFPLYNGNISETYWITSNDNTKRKYGYSYDSLNRLKESIYQKPGATTAVTNSYNESMGYDKNGNIVSLKRNGAYEDNVYNLQIDNLTYFYENSNATNRLMKVTDATNESNGFKDDSNGTNDTADDYTYDLNGNLTKDDNKGITTILYNNFNLPFSITFVGTNKNIKYFYNAVGDKVKKTVTNGGTIVSTDYLDSFQYENAVLKFFPTSEGYVSNTIVSGVNTFNYIFNYTDHLGNIRLSYTKDPTSGSLKIIEESHYYPYGLKQSGYNTSQFEYTLNLSSGTKPTPCATCYYKYKYNGKELQEELGLNVTAMDFRQYDMAIGRFNSMDELAEEDPDFTPYRFAYDNPNYWNDPSGLSEVGNNGSNNITGWVNQGGKTFWDPRVNNARDVRRLYDGTASYVPDNTVTPNGDGTSTRYNPDGTKTEILPEVVVKGTVKKKSSASPIDWTLNGWWGHLTGPALYSLALPSPKRFVAQNSSQTSAVFSETVSKAFPKKIKIKIGKKVVRRLYTHTVNGSSRYAATWGRFLGRWGTRFAGTVGLALTVYDVATEVAPPMAKGLEGYQQSTQDEGIIFRVCFAKGTLVRTNVGFTPIEKIIKEQEIPTYNLKTKKMEYGKIKNTIEREVSELYKLVTTNQEVYVTEEHPFYVVNRGWVKVKDLRVGDLLKTNNEIPEELKFTEKEKKSIIVYNLEVDSNHNYFVTTSSILVHNKKIKIVKKNKKN